MASAKQLEIVDSASVAPSSASVSPRMPTTGARTGRRRVRKESVRLDTSADRDSSASSRSLGSMGSKNSKNR